MWHKVREVAQSRQVDPDLLTAYALENRSRYGLSVERGAVEVNTWYVDDLVKDFVAHASIKPLAQGNFFEV